VDFDEEYIRAIEQQQIAQETIETAKYQADAAEYEKERQIRLAEAEAQRIRLLAGADAERQRLLADAEAYGIQVRGEALQEFPDTEITASAPQSARLAITPPGRSRPASPA